MQTFILIFISYCVLYVTVPIIFIIYKEEIEISL